MSARRWSKTGNLHSADPQTSAVWAAGRIGGATGIQQKVAFSLPLLSEIIRVWLTLLDREPESRENHGTQNSGCKPSHGYGTKLWLLNRSAAKLVDWPVKILIRPF
jgi:hypothetical protein